MGHRKYYIYPSQKNHIHHQTNSLKPILNRYLIEVFCNLLRAKRCWLENSLVFAHNAFALQIINRPLNSSLDKSLFLVMFLSYLSNACGWFHVAKICTTEKPPMPSFVG